MPARKAAACTEYADDDDWVDHRYWKKVVEVPAPKSVAKPATTGMYVAYL
jgi:hypothetical protein